MAIGRYMIMRSMLKTYIGDNILLHSFSGIKDDKAEAVAEALCAAQKLHEFDKRDALEKSRHQAERELTNALASAKQEYAHSLAVVTSKLRKDEDQRVEALHKQWNERMHAEMKAQLANFERRRGAIIEEGLKELRKAMRAEFSLAKERDVAVALRHARENFQRRERNVVEITKRECETAAELKHCDLRKEYEDKFNTLQHQYEGLLEDYMAEIEHRQLVERDFKELQEDYRRFLDKAKGQFKKDKEM